MRVALVGAELEENLGIRYMASALEHKGHQVEIVPFNTEYDVKSTVERVNLFNAQIVGLSMVFTGRAREFCRLAQALRESGFCGHLIAGGHFASFNCERLLRDFSAFDSIGLGEGEDLICALADQLDQIEQIPGICFRRADGSIATHRSTGNKNNLDALPFPKRDEFHDYYGKPIASILTSRGCWRNCAFCSINAWYQRGGGKKFRARSIKNIIDEMKELYFRHGVRIFNFQDDNFFLPDSEEALQRFTALRDGLKREGVEGIAIAIKARPDSITHESAMVLNDLGLFRVFLGVENASERGLRNLNRKCTFDQILNALRILNSFDVHIAFNLLMFEPDTVMDDILINLRFIERHIENPINFCRAEAYAGTGLEAKLVSEGRLLGDYFGFDYRLQDPRSEAFHQIANHAFFDRNFSDFGLHYFNMQVDFSFQLLRRFWPDSLSQTLRCAVRNFIKKTNLDTYECLCQVYDFTMACDPKEYVAIRAFARELRKQVDQRSLALHDEGEGILRRLDETYRMKDKDSTAVTPKGARGGRTFLDLKAGPIQGLWDLQGTDGLMSNGLADGADLLGMISAPIPYDEFKRRMGK